MSVVWFTLKMVKIKLKCDFGVQFLVETSLETALSDLLPDLAFTYNGILRVLATTKRLEEFANELERHSSHGERSGEACSTEEELSGVNTLRKVIAEARDRVSNIQMDLGNCITKDLIINAEGIFKNVLAVLKVPERMLAEKEKLMDECGTGDVVGQLSDHDAKLWWAGKELTRDKQLREFVGTNEKTTITATLCGAPPTKSGSVDTERTVFLLAQMRREREFRSLETDVEDLMLSDTRSLHKAVYGLSDVKWKP